MSRLRKGLLGLVLFSLTACSTTQNTSQNTSEPPTQAPAVSTVAEGDGFGGTGTPVQVAYQPSGDESGFGGTGVIGTIEAMGSIWVNGLHIHYPENQTFKANIQGDYPLQVGQQVVLQTDFSAERIYSQHIRVHFPIAGQISKIENNRFQIANQWIIWNDQTQSDVATTPQTLRLGQYVLVNGWQTVSTENTPQTAQWQATRISANPDKIEQFAAQIRWPFNYTVQQFVVEKALQTPELTSQLQQKSQRILLRSGRFSQSIKPNTLAPKTHAPHWPSQPAFKGSGIERSSSGMRKMGH